jgi:hypothetical protein
VRQTGLGRRRTFGVEAGGFAEKHGGDRPWTFQAFTIHLGNRATRRRLWAAVAKSGPCAGGSQGIIANDE